MKIGTLIKSNSSGVAWSSLNRPLGQQNYSKPFFKDQFFIYAGTRCIDNIEFIAIFDLKTAKWVYPAKYFNFKFHEVKTK